MIFCIFFIKKINTKPLRVFFLYTIIQAVFSFLCYYFIYISNSYSNYILALRVHLVLEYLLIALFMYNILESGKAKTGLLISLPLFLIYNIYDFFSNDNVSFSNNPTLIEFLIFIVLIIFYLFEKMKVNQETPAYSSINFWLNVGLFVYFTGNFFYILLVENSATASIAVKNQLIVIYCIITIMKNLILSFAFVKNDIEDSIKNNNKFQFPQDLNFDTF